MRALVIGLVVVSPWLSTSWGFALSTTATAGLVLLAPRIDRALIDKTGSLTTTCYLSRRTGIELSKVQAAFRRFNEDLTDLPAFAGDADRHFGIIPPPITPSLSSLANSPARISRISVPASFGSRINPGTSLMKTSRRAARAIAACAAATSALQL